MKNYRPQWDKGVTEAMGNKSETNMYIYNF